MYFQCPGRYIVGTLSTSLQCICSVPAWYTTLCPQCKLCRCRDEEDVEVAEVEGDDDLTSELSYETEYHTPVAIAGLLEDVPNRLVPIGELEITRGGFEEEVRDGDEDSDQELESLASQVAERTLEEEDDQQVVGLSRD